MFSFLSRLTNLSIVSAVFKHCEDYPNVEYGFERDRQHLYQDCHTVVRALNYQVVKYGKEYTN